MLSFTMAIIVLFSTLSFTIESHYCGNHLVDTAIFYKVKNCGKETSVTTVKKSCCKKEVVVLEGQDQLKLNTFEDLNIIKQIIFTSYIYAYVSLFKSLPKQTIPQKEYAPPNLIYDIQVLDETFLI